MCSYLVGFDQSQLDIASQVQPPPSKAHSCLENAPHVNESASIEMVLRETRFIGLPETPVC